MLEDNTEEGTYESKALELCFVRLSIASAVALIFIQLPLSAHHINFRKRPILSVVKLIHGYIAVISISQDIRQSY